MLCQGCKSKLHENNFLKCNMCAFQYCFLCLNITKKSTDQLTKEQIKCLNCPNCQNVTKRRHDDDTVCRPRSKSDSFNESMNNTLGNTSRDSFTSVAMNCSSGSIMRNEPVTMESISKLFDLKLAPDSAIMTNLRSALNKDIERMVEAHVSRAVENLKDEFTETTDYLTAEQNDMKSEIKEKDIEIRRLQLELNKNNNSLAKLQSRVAIMEKISRDMNLEIHEVPESRNEDVMGLFKNLCKCLDVIIPDGDIRTCRRVAKMDTTTKRPRNILVTLSSQHLRDRLLSATTRFNKSHPNDKLSSTHIGITGETRRIYLAEHLAPEVKEIYSAARKFCKQCNFKFVWVRFGQIYVRKNEQCPAIHIKSLDCLSKLM